MVTTLKLPSDKLSPSPRRLKCPTNKLSFRRSAASEKSNIIESFGFGFSPGTRLGVSSLGSPRGYQLLPRRASHFRLTKTTHSFWPHSFQNLLFVAAVVSTGTLGDLGVRTGCTNIIAVLVKPFQKSRRLSRLRWYVSAEAC